MPAERATPLRPKMTPVTAKNAALRQTSDPGRLLQVRAATARGVSAGPL